MESKPASSQALLDVEDKPIARVFTGWDLGASEYSVEAEVIVDPDGSFEVVSWKTLIPLKDLEKTHQHQWDNLPPAAQRLALVESARNQHGARQYHAAPRHEMVNGETWQVSTSGNHIVLVGNVGEGRVMEGQFEANRLRSQAGQLVLRINSTLDAQKAGQGHLDRTIEEKRQVHPDRQKAVDEIGLNLETMRAELIDVRKALEVAEAAAAIQTEVTFAFPIKLWEDEKWM